jgi:hypothetical protein
MKKFATLALAGAITLSTLSPLFAAPPTQVSAKIPSPFGFSTLLCTADALLAGAELPTDSPIILFGGQVKIESLSNVTTTTTPDILQINVKITHGKKSSQHILLFMDDGSSPDTLNCGDTIVGVF